jgi:hypothetical protein
MAMSRAFVAPHPRRILCWLVAAVVVLQAFAPLTLRVLARSHFHPTAAGPAGAGRLDLNAALAHTHALGHGHAHVAHHGHDAGSDAIDVDDNDSGTRALDLQAPLPKALRLAVAKAPGPQAAGADEVFRSRPIVPPDKPPRG